MQEKQLFEYSIIRLVPCVERQEFLNVGVIVYCPDNGFLRAVSELNLERVKAICSEVDIEEIRTHLSALERICIGGADSGPIGALPVGERFRWLTAPRSTIVQTSPVHTGLCENADETIETLMDRMVR